MRERLSVSGSRKLAIVAVAALLGSATPVAAEMATGTVFEDLNGNGLLDAGEPGVAGVRVSDGETVRLTDEYGRYRLEIDDEAVIFITKPRGYAVPVNDDQLPQFYYIHQPNGSPPSRYPGVSPTGPLPESINFPLLAHE